MAACLGTLTNVSNGAMGLPSGGGPFIPNETFHTITLPSTGGFTGTIRVKLLPWNAVWLDIAVRWTGTTGTAYNCGSLPSSAYYPTTGRTFPLGVGGAPNTDTPSSINIPTSGALVLFTGASSGGSGTTYEYGCSVMYPTN